MTNPDSKQRGDHITDLNVMTGRCSLHKKHGVLDRDPVNVGCSNFSQINDDQSNKSTQRH